MHCLCLALSFLLLQQPAQALIPVRCWTPPPPPPPSPAGCNLGAHAAHATLRNSGGAALAGAWHAEWLL